MIPTEANYAEWFTCSARYYLLKEGYAFLSFGVEQVVEPGFPGARLFAAGNRLVGLRFVRPVEPAPGHSVREYQVDEAALADVADWVYLALPLTADPVDQQLAHTKLRFVRAEGLEVAGAGAMCADAGLTFAALLTAMQGGSAGREVPDGWTHEELLAEVAVHPATLYLVMNASARVVFALHAS